MEFSSSSATGDQAAHSSYSSHRSHSAQSADDATKQSHVQSLRSEGPSVTVKWHSEESVTLARVRKLALGLQRTLTILALITGTLTGVLLASSGLARLNSLTATLSPSPSSSSAWPRPLSGSTLTPLSRAHLGVPCFNARSSSDVITDPGDVSGPAFGLPSAAQGAEKRSSLEDGGLEGREDDVILESTAHFHHQQLEHQAADIRHQGLASKGQLQQQLKQQHGEEEGLEPAAEEILRVGDEALDSEKKTRGSSADPDAEAEEGDAEEEPGRDGGQSDDAAILRRAAQIYETWTRLYFPELVQNPKKARKRGRSMRENSDAAARVAHGQTAARVGARGNDQNAGAEALLEGESLWVPEVDLQAGEASLGSTRGEEASRKGAQKPEKASLGSMRAEAAEEREEKRRGERRGKGRGVRRRGGGRDKAGGAQPLDRVPRPHHLQNCTLLQAIYREDGWIDRLPSGELAPWAQIRDPMGGASERAEDYILPPTDRQKAQRHWASRAVNRTVSEAFWWPSRKASSSSSTGESEAAPHGRQLYSRVSSGFDKEGALRDPLSEGPFPPWVEGGDSDNYPLTRRVQRDIWVHQHPPNCSDPAVKFWYSGVGPREKHGFGAQMDMAAGALALAVAEGRVLVLRRFNRAAHRGCTGVDHNRLSCYFAPETSEACRRRVEELMRDPHSTRGKDPPLKLWEAAHPLDYFFPPVPPLWGQPWLRIPPVVEAKGQLIRTNRMGNKYRWWRAQAFKYLMRAPTEYTCHVVNRERHLAFGQLAALEAARGERALWGLGHYVREGADMRPGPMERELWARDRLPWVPRPLVAMHVRMGDKAREMAIAGVEDYLELLGRVRAFDPAATHVWLSTEMQLVLDVALEQKGWQWHYSRIRRMQGNDNKMRMPLYEESLGVKESVENSLANLFISLQADYFIGALGSAWSYLIDGLRCTSGKMRNGFLSTNVSPRW